MTPATRYERFRAWVLSKSVLAPRHRALAFRIIVFALWTFFMGYVIGRSYRPTPPCPMTINQHAP